MKILQPLFTDFIAENDDYDLSQIYIEKKVFDPNSCRWIDKSAIDNFQEALYKEMKSEKLAKYEKKRMPINSPTLLLFHILSVPWRTENLKEISGKINIMILLDSRKKQTGSSF